MGRMTRNHRLPNTGRARLIAPLPEIFMRGLLTFSFLLLLMPAAHAQTPDCARPPMQSVMHIPLPGHPFSAIPSRDGCSIFVSLRL